MSKIYQYVLAIPLEREKAFEVVSDSVNAIGKFKKFNETTGYMKIKIKWKKSAIANKYHLNFGYTVEDVTPIMAFYKVGGTFFEKKHSDIAWGNLITEITQTHHIQLDVTPDEKPHIVRTYRADSNISQITNTTAQGASVTRALIGGALFGGAGAIVGGMTGKKRSTSASSSVFSNEGLFIAEYSNGRVGEIKAKKGSKLYNELCAKMVK